MGSIIDKTREIYNIMKGDRIEKYLIIFLLILILGCIVLAYEIYKYLNYEYEMFETIGGKLVYFCICILPFVSVGIINNLLDSLPQDLVKQGMKIYLYIFCIILASPFINKSRKFYNDSKIKFIGSSLIIILIALFMAYVTSIIIIIE